MKIWKNNKLDAILFILSILHFIAVIFFATQWEYFSLSGKIVTFILLIIMMVYNIIIISHLFTHTAWFESALLNTFVSMLNSLNIGQSVQVYQFNHVRNHHRYNNDQKNADGKTNDLSSTFQDGQNNEHASLFQYAFKNALITLCNTLIDFLSIFRFCRVGKREYKILKLAARSAEKSNLELRQIQLDRITHFVGICLFISISWKWFLICYIPAFYLSLAFVNMQNYFEHYGANPAFNIANSVSYYGRLYNFLAFNDGFHQEHHLCPAYHWSKMLLVRHMYNKELTSAKRIVSSFPAILGFLDQNREMLHKQIQNQISIPSADEGYVNL